MAERKTRKELGVLWGISETAVGKMVRAGRMTQGDDGKIDLAEAQQARAGLNPNIVAKEAEAKALGGQQNAQQSGHQMVQARTVEAVMKAKHRELVVKRLSGELVHINKVKAECFEAGRAAQQHIRALPQRLAGELKTLFALPVAEIEPAIRQVLDRETRVILSNLIQALEEISVGDQAA
jgi:ribosomal protein L16 Arg81 hydroxylase